MIQVLYFAWFRSLIGTGSEQVDPPAEVATVGDLITWLARNNLRHAEAFADRSVVRAAVNQEFVQPDHPLKPGDEVALFPPVTGGASADEAAQ